uniref:Uncharacterized protein n=1 Tax=Vespula pensylvanica TaxID=30213 RepID=A0A834NZM9_VESPE|nr:hypothetical protein H0235_008384 [Vespula pensylvanica]
MRERRGQRTIIRVRMIKTERKVKGYRFSASPSPRFSPTTLTLITTQLLPILEVMAVRPRSWNSLENPVESLRSAGVSYSPSSQAFSICFRSLAFLDTID